MLSYWEQKNYLNYDLVVVGAGIVGLSTAIRYKEKFPQRSVLVMERGVFPTGASSRNAGFACFGSLTEILDDLESMSSGKVCALVERRFRGLQAIRSVFGDKALDYQGFGGFEMISEKELPALEQIGSVNALLRPIFGQDVFAIHKDPSGFGFGDKVKSVVVNAWEGELDSGKFIQALWEKAAALQVKIITGAEVEEVLLEDKKVVVNHSLRGSISFSGFQIAICTNAFTGKLFPELDIRPGRGLIMVSGKLKQPIPWKGSFHYDKGYVYFRNVENRLLIGGGRNMDFQGENTVDFGTNPRIKAYLLDIIKDVIFPEQDLKIEMEWSGIMAFGPDKMPIVKLLSQDVGCAVRLGGMGVAIGWQTAGELVDLLSA